MIDYVVASPALLAAIFTLVGGVVLKLLEKILSKDKRVREDRKEFRDEWKELLERIDALEAEVDQWKQKYYRVMEDNLTLKAMIVGAGLAVPHDASILDEPK